MDLETPCDHCGERKAVATCEVCGAHVCSKHNREFGCAECKGGEQSF